MPSDEAAVDSTARRSTSPSPTIHLNMSHETASLDGPSPAIESPPRYDAQPKTGKSADPSAPTIAQRTLAPHILVFFDGDDVPPNAWGRDGVARMGYGAFANLLFTAYVSHPSTAPPKRGLFRRNPARKAFWRKHCQLKQHFGAHVKLMASFVRTSGGLDAAGPVRMQPGGWPEMVQNVVEIHVEYEPPAGAFAFKRK